LLFDLQNFWLFVLAVAAIYAVIVNFIQNNIGGKGRMKALQKEMTEVQKKMLDAAKSGRDPEYKEQTERYNKLTFELVGMQLQMTAIFLLLYYPTVALLFPAFEPGMEDDVRVGLYDDGLASHCDALPGDGIFSGCYPLPPDGVKGAWVASVNLNSSEGYHLARQDAAIYYQWGKPEDVWLQSVSVTGFLDSFSGKKPYSLNVTTDKTEYSGGQAVAVFARPMQRVFSSQSNLNEIVRSFRENKVEIADKEISEISGFILSESSQKTMAIGNQTYHLAKHGTLFGDEAVVWVNNAPQGAILEATFNSGTFFHVDLPFPLPLLNIRRIIGSNGVFIFFAFVSGIAYSVTRSALGRIWTKFR